MKRLHVLVAVALFVAGSTANAAIVFNEGDFSTWTFGSSGVGGGTATATREAAGGNPGARVNVTTVTASLAQTAFGTGFKNDYSTTAALAGTTFTLTLDVLSGAGAFGQGQAIQLVVEQGGAVYAMSVGVTNVQAAFVPVAFAGTFNAGSFTLVSGAGPATPNFAGGVATRFGFAAGNTNSATLTQYYDNVRLDLSVVPAAAPTASDIPLLGPWTLAALAALLGLAGVGRLRRR
jgi:hypothetical protein